MSKGSSRLIAVLKWSLIAIVVAYVVIAMAKQFRAFDWRTAHFRTAPLALATFFLTVIYAARTISFRLLLRGYGMPADWRGVAVVAWVPQIGKYVPGQVMSVLGAVGLLRKFGVPAAVGLSVVLVMDGLAVLTGLVSGSPLFFWQPVRDRVPYGWLLCLLVIVAGGVALSPQVLGRLINFALTKARKAPLQSMPPVRNYVGPVVLGFVQWMLAGLALWCTARAVTDVPARWIFLFTAIAALGYTAGYVSPLPGGAGVRELVFQTTLTLLIGPAAAVTVLTVRLIQTAVELIMAAAGIFIYRSNFRPQMGTNKTESQINADERRFEGRA